MVIHRNRSDGKRRIGSLAFRDHTGNISKVRPLTTVRAILRINLLAGFEEVREPLAETPRVQVTLHVCRSLPSRPRMSDILEIAETW